MDLETPVLARLREHLLSLGRHSIAPQFGAPRATAGSDDESAVLLRFRPFAELFFLVASADGTIDARERAVTLGAFRALTGGRVKSASLEKLEQELADQLKAEGAMTMLESVCSSLASDREDAELAFTLGSVVALADETFAGDEAELLAQLAKWLRIPQARASELLTEV